VPDPNDENAFYLRTERHGNAPVDCNPALIVIMRRGNVKGQRRGPMVPASAGPPGWASCETGTCSPNVDLRLTELAAHPTCFAFAFLIKAKRSL
jgi:hypothetical protein